MENDGLSTGDTVDLIGNPLSGYSQNYEIPQLVERGVTVAPATGAIQVTFSDPNLEAAIREAINKPDGLIFIPDLERVTVLIAQEKGISDLTGLEHCVNLKQLYLDDNTISDISPLAGLTNLEDLNLQLNNITDISPLANLSNLRRLLLHSNSASEISILINLINLEYLDLYNNNISDISPLVENSGLSTGDTVDLRNNPLNSDSVNIYIPQLEARGVTVHR